MVLINKMKGSDELFGKKSFFDTVEFEKSRYLQIVRNGDQAVAWHSLFGYTKIISEETANFLESFVEPSFIALKFDGESMVGEEDVVAEICDCYFIVPVDFDERELLERKMKLYSKKISDGSLVNYLSLIMSDDCNFACTYCFHSGNLESTDRVLCHDKLMSFDVAKRAIDEYVRVLMSNHKKTALINFGGGEPLIAWPVIKRILHYCKDNYGQAIDLVFSINTNASLITQGIAKILKEFSVNIAPSLDGLRIPNDKVRVRKDGSGTYDAIIAGFENLQAIDYPVKGFSVTLTDKNFYEFDESFIDFAKTYKVDDLSIDIDLIGTVEISIDEIVSKVLRLRRYADSLGIAVAGFWLRPIENLGRYSHKKPISFCGGVRGNSICVDHYGDIYSCGYSNYSLGSIYDMESFFLPNAVYIEFVKAHLTGVKEMCKGCMIEGQCAGGCNITQEYCQEDKIEKVARMCQLYKAATKMLLYEILQA